MSQPIFSKHFRLKTYKTPILRELIIYSRKKSRPNPKYVDQITSVLRQIPVKEQNSYKHLSHMSNDLADYLSTSVQNSASPKRKISFSINKLIRHPSRKNNSRESFSPVTKNLAFSLNRHKLEEEKIRQPKFEKDSGFEKDVQHRTNCDCKMREVDLKSAGFCGGFEYKLFISCKFAASDLPELTENKVNSILSVGTLPKCYPAIKGGYFLIDYFGTSLFKPLQQISRFLNTKLRAGNVLIHCEDGNKKSVVLLTAYLLKEMKTTFRTALSIISKARPFYYITDEEREYLKKLDKNV